MTPILIIPRLLLGAAAFLAAVSASALSASHTGSGVYRAMAAPASAAHSARRTGPSARLALLDEINRARLARHLPPLILDATQSRCSRAHSIHMAQTATMSHDQFPGDVCVAYAYAAENVGEAYGRPRPVLTALNDEMMAEGPCRQSPCRSSSDYAQHDHYVNLMGAEYRRIGIGVFVWHGRVWLTEDLLG